MRVQQLTFAALALAAGISLSACQNNDSDSAQDSQPPASSAPSDSSASSNASDPTSGSPQDDGTGSGGQEASAGKPPAQSGGTGKCRTDNLTFTAVDSAGGGDEDNGFVALGLTNHGSTPCILSGFAGVDLTTNGGPISAAREGQPATPVTLRVGKEIDFGLTYPLNKTGGSGVRITGMLVTPPGETKPAHVNWPGAASLPASDTSSAVRVGPIGSAGQGG
ncbi:DUF4232 domain-containing protein [Streptomyces sp. SID14478]|uniref:DUF4232 domain-containing protein n=1 Tax=Streptomyces sp. SID14478 TaxID=2706073 RepID=UPI0013D8E1E2|nr:DUF4232 domain-containing protein [Streptomyces sp. SID14478]NEB74230.1 DUF4232 domain-containing protein [Streptomyces sp. SID14478]